jgi:serine/threonine-protein kinase
MAPEQLAGKEVSVRSDVYGLGLVLYELFTGKPAFARGTAADVARRRAESAPASPSTLVEGLSPVVERVILRCLERDPGDRPSSVAAVAAALPGGDPLAAAVAAGETPSPEMVAAAGEAGTIPIRRALVYVGIIVAGIVGALIIGEPYAPHRQYPLEKAPAVLEDRSRQLLGVFDYDEPAVDRAYGFEWDYAFASYVESELENSAEYLVRDQPSSLYFWYRQSPAKMAPLRGSIFGVYGDRVSRSDPPLVEPGMAEILLSPRGKLMSFRRVPPLVRTGDPPREPFDWSLPFREAGLEFERFEAVEPSRAPPVPTDARRAWKGSYPEAPDIELRVAAATLDGRPVYFELLGPWAFDDDPATAPGEADGGVAEAVFVTIFLTVLIGCIWMARRNLRLGRGDRKGAIRLCIWLFFANMIFWVFGASHVGSVGIDGLMLLGAVSWALARSAFTAVLYIALEPYIRRNWPDRIISWSRLLAGRLRDPLVGRDTMFGLIVMSLSILLLWALFRWGGEPIGPGPPLDPLTSPRHAIGSLFSGQNGAVGNSFALVFLLIMLRTLLRKAWLASIVWTVALVALFWGGLGGDLIPALPMALIMGGGFSYLIHRCGLLSLVVGVFCFGIVIVTPMTLDFGVWYATGTIVVLALLAGMTAHAFVTTTRGQTLFAEDGPG